MIKPGLNTVAAPVLGIDGAPIGYLAVIGLFSAQTVTKTSDRLLLKQAKHCHEQLGATID